MVQLGPNFTNEIWNEILYAHGIKPTDYKASNALRKTLLNKIRESLIEYVNFKFQQRKIKKKLVMTDSWKNRIRVIDNSKPAEVLASKLTE